MVRYLFIYPTCSYIIFVAISVILVLGHATMQEMKLLLDWRLYVQFIPLFAGSAMMYLILRTVWRDLA